MAAAVSDDRSIAPGCEKRKKPNLLLITLRAALAFFAHAG
jgi:hypothetical protein